jgi:hypothetical protein
MVARNKPIGGDNRGRLDRHRSEVSESEELSPSKGFNGGLLHGALYSNHAIFGLSNDRHAGFADLPRLSSS